MAFSYSGFVADLMDLTIAGVETVYDSKPTEIDLNDVPLMYPDLPTGDDEVISLGGVPGLRHITCEIVIAVDAIRRGKATSDYATCVALMDTAHTALAADPNSIGIDRWGMSVEERAIGESEFRALVITVEGSG